MDIKLSDWVLVTDDQGTNVVGQVSEMLYIRKLTTTFLRTLLTCSTSVDSTHMSGGDLLVETSSLAAARVVCVEQVGITQVIKFGCPMTHLTSFRYLFSSGK